MPSLTAEGFIISLPLGQNNVRVVDGAICFAREHFIHRSRNADPTGNDLGYAAESRVFRVLNGRVIKHLAAANHYRQLHLRKTLFELLQKQLVEHDLAAVIRQQQQAFCALALIGERFKGLQIVV